MPSRSLEQWLGFISETHPSEIEMGLDRVKAVYSRLPTQSTQAKVVLVAGTNGKGSTIAMIEACLLALGYSVGVYTSPHILSYNERIRINSVNVSDSELIHAFESVETARGSTPLTYFEYGTLAALDILLAKKLDVILLEIGLGGRLDAVNVAQPDLSIITSIALDHTDWLGDTIEKIGVEKAGILRPKGLFISGEDLPQSVFNISNNLLCTHIECRQDFDVSNVRSKKITTLMHHFNQIQFDGFPRVLLPENNILLALQSILCLFELLEPNKIVSPDLYRSLISAIENTHIPGRLEHVIKSDKHNVFLDVGHNPHAAIYLKDFLMQYADSGSFVQIVYSSLLDKDVSGVLSQMALVSKRCILTHLDCDRAMPLNDLSAIAVQAGMESIESYNNVVQAFDSALNLPDWVDNDHSKVVTLILGSFFMVEAAKKYLDKVYD